MKASRWVGGLESSARGCGRLSTDYYFRELRREDAMTYAFAKKAENRAVHDDVHWGKNGQTQQHDGHADAAACEATRVGRSDEHDGGRYVDTGTGNAGDDGRVDGACGSRKTGGTRRRRRGRCSTERR